MHHRLHALVGLIDQGKILTDFLGQVRLLGPHTAQRIGQNVKGAKRYRSAG